MSSEYISSPEKYEVPKLSLEEGVDFIDTEELYSKIADELDKLRVDPDRALLCGHSDRVESEPRLITFALPLSQIQEELEYPTEMTPSDYAINQSVIGGGSPVISVYDAERLKCVEGAIQEYEMLDGKPLKGAILLEVNLLLR